MALQVRVVGSVPELVAVPLAMAAVSGKGAGGAGASTGFKPFTAANFRENLARLTGGTPKGAQAHHIFPQRFADDFEKVDINIHDPRYGAWWQSPAHQSCNHTIRDIAAGSCASPLGAGQKETQRYHLDDIRCPLLVSERAIAILREAGFTGWSTYDVNLVGYDGASIPGYYGFSVHGRCGPIDESKAVQVPRIMPGGVFPVWLGMYFDPDTWDGSDLFMPADGWGSILLVEDVKRAFEKAKIKPVKFTSLPECRVHK